MSQAMFTYNQEAATQIGGGQYVTKSGGYELKIVRAQFINNKALEFDFETRDGLKLNYVSINYTKNNGEANDFGHKMIQAIMGCTGVQGLSQDAQGNCPELFGKFMKGVVQRVDYTKTGGANAGQDGYKFDFKLPANMQTGKTVKEQVNGDPAQSFGNYAGTITDKDERQPHNAQVNQHATHQQSSYAAASQGGMHHQSQDFEDIPF